MSLQKVHCRACGVEYAIEFGSASGGGYGRNQDCCSKECWHELKWRETLSILGKQYRIRPDVEARFKEMGVEL